MIHPTYDEIEPEALQLQEEAVAQDEAKRESDFNAYLKDHFSHWANKAIRTIIAKEKGGK